MCDRETVYVPKYFEKLQTVGITWKECNNFINGISDLTVGVCVVQYDTHRHTHIHTHTHTQRREDEC